MPVCPLSDRSGTGQAAQQHSALGSPEQLAKLLLDHAVALARGRLETRAVEDGDPATGIGNRASLLEDGGGHRHAGPPDPEHHREKLLGQRQGIAGGAVMGHQQPARQPLLKRVVHVAHRGL
jgi:hypothetical protein